LRNSISQAYPDHEWLLNPQAVCCHATIERAFAVSAISTEVAADHSRRAAGSRRCSTAPYQETLP
jgi:hypothetical protein